MLLIGLPVSVFLLSYDPRVVREELGDRRLRSVDQSVCDESIDDVGRLLAGWRHKLVLIDDWLSSGSLEEQTPAHRGERVFPAIQRNGHSHTDSQ